MGAEGTPPRRAGIPRIVSASFYRARSRAGELTLDSMRELLCRDRGFIRPSDPTVVAFIGRGKFGASYRNTRIRGTVSIGRWRSRGIDLLPIVESEELRMSVQESASGLLGADEWITFRRPRGRGDELEPVTLAAFFRA